MIERAKRWGGCRIAGALLGIFALWNVSAAAYIAAKAELAQFLLDQAWQQTVEGGNRIRPWDWADTWPVARLVLPASGEKAIILEGASGRNLAFGPGHLSATPLPGESGNSVIVGHRDTHFAMLEGVLRGDNIVMELRDRRLVYRVEDIGIVHETNVAVLGDAGTEALTLITCYPFDALDPGGDQRYVIRAELQQ